MAVCANEHRLSRIARPTRSIADTVGPPPLCSFGRRLLGLRADLLEERQRVEVVAAFLDFVALEGEEDGGGRLLTLARGQVVPSAVVSGPVCVPFQVTSKAAVSRVAKALVTVPAASGNACFQPLKSSTIFSGPSTFRSVPNSSKRESEASPARTRSQSLSALRQRIGLRARRTRREAYVSIPGGSSPGGLVD